MSVLDQLDLTEDEVQSGGRILRPGVYVGVSSDAKWVKKDASREFVTVTLTDEEGRGRITINFNLKNPSTDAVRIGRSQLKTFLTHGGHPNPNKPNDLNGYNGLRVAFAVKEDGDYTDRNGVIRTSYAIDYFMKPIPGLKTGPSGGDVPTAQAAHSTNPSRDLDDEIPF